MARNRKPARYVAWSCSPTGEPLALTGCICVPDYNAGTIDRIRLSLDPRTTMSVHRHLHGERLECSKAAARESRKPSSMSA